MSLEEKMERAAAALELIAKSMTSVAAPVMPADVDPPMPQAPGNVTPITPPEPTPAPAPEQTANYGESPWKNEGEMQNYVKSTYAELGDKGNKMVEIISEMGIQTIKDLTPDRYAEFYQKVETLKAS